MTESLFVYGTLCPGRENEEVLSCVGGEYEEATIRGIHYPDGWLEGFPYPGVTLDEQGEAIPGFIFTSPDLWQHWGRLDAFEGDHYERVRTIASTRDGRETPVFVYAIKSMP